MWYHMWDHTYNPYPFSVDHDAVIASPSNVNFVIVPLLLVIPGVHPRRASVWFICDFCSKAFKWLWWRNFRWNFGRSLKFKIWINVICWYIHPSVFSENCFYPNSQLASAGTSMSANWLSNVQWYSCESCPTHGSNKWTAVIPVAKGAPDDNGT